MKRTNIQKLTYIALGAALITALSQISIPIGPVPFTLQTLGVGLIASLYRPKLATSTILLYLLLGAIGLPVFAGFTGGFSALIGPTGGFLIGFLAYAALTSLILPDRPTFLSRFLGNLAGNVLCFLIGIAVFMLVAQTSLLAALTYTTIPFILPELVKITLITLVQPRLTRFIQK